MEKNILYEKYYNYDHRDDHLKADHFRKPENMTVYPRIEPRTRDHDFAEALSFRTFDPMWFLTRQWQYGRFKGNDCGSAVTAKVKVRRRPMENIVVDNRLYHYDREKPLEYMVECRDREPDLQVRIESAAYFQRRLRRRCSDEAEYRRIVDILWGQCPLDDPMNCPAQEGEAIEPLKTAANAKLLRMYKLFGQQAFDGYRLLLKIADGGIPELQDCAVFEEVAAAYQEWFIGKYMPNMRLMLQKTWNERKLGYDFSVQAENQRYRAEDYQNGHLAWYNFDLAAHVLPADAKTVKFLSYLPVPAVCPGAPSRNLWEFEDNKVMFGDLRGENYSFLANAVIMQYVSMYSNDWLQIPFEIEQGTVADVERILVKDSFGEYINISHAPEDNDRFSRPDHTFIDRWCLFRHTYTDAYSAGMYEPGRGFLVPPTLARCNEGKPVEEVHFLRDEMANMVWAVEDILSNGCGGSMSGKTLSDKVMQVLKKQEIREVEKDPDAEYSYLFQNRVPVNWIPFLPQKIKGEAREILFRRGRMPLFYKDAYQSVRPGTSLLKVRRGPDGKVVPFTVNEEELSGSGIKLSLTPQRTRWFNGTSFTWYGFTRRLSGLQANSGLMNDQLIARDTGRNIETQRKEE